MEQLATEAGVSNPLIYKYFDTRLQVLQELLVREYAEFRKSIAQQVKQVTRYRDAVRRYVEINFEQFSSGDVLSILFSQADVRQVLQEKERTRHAPFLIRQLAQEYKIDNRLAERMIVLASGASLSAAEYYGKYGGDKNAQIDETVEFILGGIEGILASSK